MPSDAKQGPVLTEAKQEVQGIFPSDAALQDAIGRLTRAGFDRAHLSLPAANPHPGDATPEAGAANPNTEDDSQQVRTLGTSAAASVGAMIGAGLTVATGGAAGVAIAAAAGLAAVAGGSVLAATAASGAAQSAGREAQAARGELVLAVSVDDPQGAAKAETAMRDAGATRVEAVRRVGGAMQ